MADLDEIALSLPQATKEADGERPVYRVHGKMFCRLRGRRPDAVDPETGERLDDVPMFRVADPHVQELLLSDTRGIYFPTPHFDGYPAALVPLPSPERLHRHELHDLDPPAPPFDGYRAVLVRIPSLELLDRDELHDLVAEAWLTRAQKRVAKAWLAENAGD